MFQLALPGLRGNEPLNAQALFHLGWASYKTGNFGEALRFNQQCMAYKGPFYEQARKNLDAIRAEQGLK